MSDSATLVETAEKAFYPGPRFIFLLNPWYDMVLGTWEAFHKVHTCGKDPMTDKNPKQKHYDNTARASMIPVKGSEKKTFMNPFSFMPMKPALILKLYPPL